MCFHSQYSYLENFKCSSRATLRCLAGRMWPAGRTLPRPAIDVPFSCKITNNLNKLFLKSFFQWNFHPNNRNNRWSSWYGPLICAKCSFLPLLNDILALYLINNKTNPEAILLKKVKCCMILTITKSKLLIPQKIIYLILLFYLNWKTPSSNLKLI